MFTALLATLGVIGSFASAYYRYEARMAEHDEGKPWTRRRQGDPRDERSVTPMNFAAPPPSTERIESTIAVDLAKKAAIVTPIVVIGARHLARRPTPRSARSSRSRSSS